GSEEARRAGRTYLAYTLTGGSALLAAVAGTAAVAGRLDFVPGGFLRPDSAGPGTLAALLALFVLGCGVKAALVPLHTWLPAAMVAPTPVSALLHAVAVVKAGVFGLARVGGFVFGPATLETLGATTALTWLALATIAFGSLAALAEDNLKRRLAFSTVSHLAYVVVGVGVGTSAAFAGALLHLGAHALLKITLFFCAGALHVGAHVERVSEMDGVGRRMPVTMGAFAVAAFLLAGLPPGAAFVSKWALLVGAADARAWAAVAGLAASGLLNIAYFAPPVVRAFRAPAAPVHGEAPAAMVVPLVVTAAAGLLVGLAPAGWLPVLPLADRAAASVTVP
ncbi:MAG TPA: proton-conducting transporter membrane subunit, partial [Calidithermus sp.]|nr:proton-conducting transporter membrane subunit [Calidithermus sp.]